MIIISNGHICNRIPYGGIFKWLGHFIMVSQDNLPLPPFHQLRINTPPYIIYLLFIFQVSPIASSPALSDQTKYPNFARLVTSDVVVADGIIALMKQYGWSRVATITQQEFLFTKVQ